MAEETKTNPEIFEAKIARVLGEIGLNVAMIKTVRYGYSDLEAPRFKITASFDLDHLQEIKRKQELNS